MHGEYLYSFWGLGNVNFLSLRGFKKVTLFLCLATGKMAGSISAGKCKERGHHGNVPATTPTLGKMLRKFCPFSKT